MTEREVNALEQQAREARYQKLMDDRQAMFDEAKKLCDKLVTGVYWKHVGSYINDYQSIVTVNLYKVNKLEPHWWGALKGDDCGGAYANMDDLQLDGEVETLLLPILPTLILSKKTDERARGVVLLESGPVVSLRVKKYTRKDAEKQIPDFLCQDDTLMFPLSIHGQVNKYAHYTVKEFSRVEPSSEAEFNKGLKLVMDFCVGAQNAFSMDIPKQ